MKIIAPNYYDKFRCVADKCKHNCCIGWEVDIDLLTLNKYENLEGSLGENCAQISSKRAEKRTLLWTKRAVVLF